MNTKICADLPTIFYICHLIKVNLTATNVADSTYGACTMYSAIYVHLADNVGECRQCGLSK